MKTGQVKNNQSRLILKLEGEFKKILWFMPDAKDHSLYVGIYSIDKQGVKYTGKIQKSDKPVQVRYRNLIPLSKQFIPNKITFHKSGYIHVNDKNGNRLEDGIINIPFAIVTRYTRLAVVALRKPNTFPVATKKELSDKWSCIADFDDLPLKPYQLHLYLVKKGIRLDIIQREKGYFGCFVTEGLGINYDLIWFFSAPTTQKNWAFYNTVFTFSR